MSSAYLSTGIFLSGPEAAGLGAWNPHHGAWNPHHAAWNPHHSAWNPHHGAWNPHHGAWNPDPRINAASNPHHGGWNPDPRVDGARLNPHPIHGAAGGLRPDPLDSGFVPSQKRSLAYDENTGSPWPWRGLNAPWTFDGGMGALEAQAMRKTQARLVGERDVRRAKAEPGQVAQPAAVVSPLWRWGSEFRQQAVVGELLGRVQVVERRLHVLSAVGGDPGSATLITQCVLAIDPSPEDFAEQIDRVLRAAVEREERLPEILSQMADFRRFFYAFTPLNQLPARRVDELLSVAWAWATHVIMMLKNHIAERRPVERSALVVPVIATPAHGSLPSGHASIAMMTACLLPELLEWAEDDGRRGLLLRLAARIAFNRVVAGVHYPIDSHVGRHLGFVLANSFRALAGEPRAMIPGHHIALPVDADWREDEVALPASMAGGRRRPAATAPCPSLKLMWGAAKNELRQLQVVQP
jgi:hypothetical protein